MNRNPSRNKKTTTKTTKRTASVNTARVAPSSSRAFSGISSVQTAGRQVSMASSASTAVSRGVVASKSSRSGASSTASRRAISSSVSNGSSFAQIDTEMKAQSVTFNDQQARIPQFNTAPLASFNVKYTAAPTTVAIPKRAFTSNVPRYQYTSPSIASPSPSASTSFIPAMKMMAALRSFSTEAVDPRNFIRDPKEVESRILNVLSTFEKIDKTKLNGDAHFQKDLGLDSLDRVEVMLAVEEEFSVEFSDEVSDRISSVKEAVEHVSQLPDHEFKFAA